MNAKPLNALPSCLLDVASPSLETLMGRVEALRARCLQRAACQRDSLPFTAEGREIAPGLYLAERRYPLWYLKRRAAEGRTRPDASSLSLPSEIEGLKLLSLCPALLDDGSSRLFLAGVGRVEHGQFLLRQAFTASPGAEPALLAWLDQELGQRGAVLCADSRSKTLLMEARRRQGWQLLLPWIWASPRRGSKPMVSTGWRDLREEADAGSQTLRANRQALLTLIQT